MIDDPGPPAPMAGPERHRRLEAIFFEALDRDAGARGEFLATACAGDRQLREEVDRLLAIDDRGEALLAATPWTTSIRARISRPERGPGAREGDRIGRYRLLQLIGRGGMGQVWLAERADEQFEQRVAVKLIRRGLDTDDILARFVQERQVLAQLGHPNIANLLDGGATEDGRPYLVMEHVEGVPIDAYCRGNGLPVADRLELFQKVCSAVQHAHRNLVVHRDLKPSNVLVTGDGEPKLLDFGIAKVLDASGGETGVTMAPQRRFTPQYASPEQARGEPLTTATDVYSLGALLYELLTGTAPHDLTDVAPTDYARVIGETDPRPPRVNGRPLPDDLERVVLMALRKEPERRYATVDQLAQDLDRYRQGRPVMARPNAAAYRVRKFVLRHRAAVAAAAVIVLALLGGVVASTSMYVRAERARAGALATSRFIESLLAAVDPREARGRDVTMLRQLLDDASARIDTDLARFPEVVSAIELTIGRTYHAIAEYEAADASLRRAVDSARRVWGPRSREAAAALHARGQLLYDLGRYDECVDTMNEVLSIRRELLPAGDPLIAQALDDLGLAHQGAGRYAEAVPMLEDAVHGLRAARRRDPAALAKALRDLGWIQADQKRPDAVAPMRESLEIFLERYGERHPEVAQSCLGMGWALRRTGRPDEAEAYYRRALEIDQGLYGPNHPQIASDLNHLAGALEDQGAFDEVERLYLEALRIFRAAFGDEHRDVGTALNNVAHFYRAQHRYEEAKQYFLEAIEIYRHTIGPDHVFVSIALENLVGMMEERGDLLAAAPYVRECLRIHDLVFPDGNVNTDCMRSVQGLLVAIEGDYVAAEPEAVGAYESLCAAVGPDDPRAQAAGRRVIEVYERWGRPADAADYRRRVAVAGEAP
jgi:tetratricopeptide (TPR) repeat protein